MRGVCVLACLCACVTGGVRDRTRTHGESEKARERGVCAWVGGVGGGEEGEGGNADTNPTTEEKQNQE